jgi:hypothetical protein
MKPEWNWMIDGKITPCPKCEENAWYDLKGSNHILCLKCGNQEEGQTASEGDEEE